jgi:hypothetical protein
VVETDHGIPDISQIPGDAGRYYTCTCFDMPFHILDIRDWSFRIAERKCAVSEWVFERLQRIYQLNHDLVSRKLMMSPTVLKTRSYVLPIPPKLKEECRLQCDFRQSSATSG